MSNQLDILFGQLQQQVEELTADLARDDSDGQQNHKRSSKNEKPDLDHFSIEYIQEEVSKINLILKERRLKNSTATATRPRPTSPQTDLASLRNSKSSSPFGKLSPDSIRTGATSLHKKSVSSSNIDHLISQTSSVGKSSVSEKNLNMPTKNGAEKKLSSSISASELRSAPPSNLLRYKSLARNNIIVPSNSQKNTNIIAITSRPPLLRNKRSVELSSRIPDPSIPSNGSNSQRISQNGNGIKRSSSITNTFPTSSSDPFTAGSLLSRESSKRKVQASLNVNRGSGKTLISQVRGSQEYFPSQRGHVDVEEKKKRGSQEYSPLQRGHVDVEEKKKRGSQEYSPLQRGLVDGNTKFVENDQKFSRSVGQKERNHRRSRSMERGHEDAQDTLHRPGRTREKEYNERNRGRSRSRERGVDDYRERSGRVRERDDRSRARSRSHEKRKPRTHEQSYDLDLVRSPERKSLRRGERMPEDRGVRERIPEDRVGVRERIPEDRVGVRERIPEDRSGIRERIPEDRSGIRERILEERGGVRERIPEDR
ncbi:6783_t:CDS:2, partial [Acaulospora morrowiae]